MDGIHYYSAAVDGSLCREISKSVAVESVLEKREQIAIRQNSPCLAIGAGGSRFLVENKWIVLHDPATGRNRRLTGSKVAASHPAWSRDGKRLVYVSCPLPILKPGQEDSNFGARWNRLRLHVMDVDGKNVRRLTEGETYQDALPQYLADNRHILFARLYRDNRQFGLWTVREDGQNLRQVVSAIGSPQDGPYADGCFDVWFHS